MRSVFIIAASSALLVGCSRAATSAPDSSDPVHCFAAFNYAAYWFKVGKEPEREAVMLARALYELDQAKQSGTNAVSEAIPFIKAHGRNQQEMDSLFMACSKNQNADVTFRAALPNLISRAKAEVLPRF